MCGLATGEEVRSMRRVHWTIGALHVAFGQVRVDTIVVDWCPQCEVPVAICRSRRTAPVARQVQRKHFFGVFVRKLSVSAFACRVIARPCGLDATMSIPASRRSWWCRRGATPANSQGPNCALWRVFRCCWCAP